MKESKSNQNPNQLKWLTLIKNENLAIKREISILFLHQLSQEMRKYPKKENNIFSRHKVQANFPFHGSDYLEKIERAWIMHLSCAIPTMGLHKFDWAQVAWINRLNASLNFFARTILTSSMGTRIWSEYALSLVLVTVLSSISTFPYSWRGFVPKSSLASKWLKSETLKVALTLYS